MNTNNCLGIWMDHNSAHIMEFTADPISTTTVNSQFTHQQKEDTLKKSEILMHHKEQHEQDAYYKNLGQIIKGYDDVVLFGPTDAKVELFNLLRNEREFDKIKITTINTDKMTENQQHAFVREHFTKPRSATPHTKD